MFIYCKNTKNKKKTERVKLYIKYQKKFCNSLNLFYKYYAYTAILLPALKKCMFVYNKFVTKLIKYWSTKPTKIPCKYLNLCRKYVIKATFCIYSLLRKCQR